MCRLRLNTQHLTLIAGDNAILAADKAGQNQLSQQLSVSMPHTWPPELGAALWRTQYIDEWLNDIRRNPSSTGWHVWYIINTQQNKLIGAIWFIYEESSRERELWMELSREHHRNGYGPEALQGFLDWAFNTNGVSHVAFRTSKRNIELLSSLYNVEMGPECGDTGIVQAKILK